MSNVQKNNLTNLYGILALVFTILQLSFSANSPIQNVAVQGLVSASFLFLVQFFTALKQKTSIEVNDHQAMKATWIVFAISVIAGITDVTNLIPWGLETAKWVRFSLTTVSMVLNAISKMLWPTSETTTKL